MAKKIEAYIKLQVPAGNANPSPPVGPALGQHGVNIMEFCKAFNAQTQSLEKNLPVPVVITVFNDRSFTFITKTPPASDHRQQCGKHHHPKGPLHRTDSGQWPLKARSLRYNRCDCPEPRHAQEHTRPPCGRIRSVL